MQTPRQHVRPAVVTIQRGAGAVGDRVAEAGDDQRVVGCRHVDGVEEIPRRRGEGKGGIVFLGAVAAGSWRPTGRRSCSALACHVIGPVAPTTWKLTARRRPASQRRSMRSLASSATGSLNVAAPGATVMVCLPWLNVTRRFVPGTRLPAVLCRPTKASSKVTGWVPKAFEKRSRTCRPHRSGLTIRRKVWSAAPRSADSKAKSSTGWAEGLPTDTAPAATPPRRRPTSGRAPAPPGRPPAERSGPGRSSRGRAEQRGVSNRPSVLAGALAAWRASPPLYPKCDKVRPCRWLARDQAIRSAPWTAASSRRIAATPGCASTSCCAGTWPTASRDPHARPGVDRERAGDRQRRAVRRVAARPAFGDVVAVIAAGDAVPRRDGGRGRRARHPVRRRAPPRAGQAGRHRRASRLRERARAR